MEIALLTQNSLRIKGKKSTFVVDPEEKAVYNAAIKLNQTIEKLKLQSETVVIQSPGEYEIGGVKISANRNESDIVYNFNIDGIDVLLGKLTSFEKMQHKLRENNIVISFTDRIINASFITSLASNVVIFYGEQAKDLVQSFGKENILTMPKYSVTVDKLPQEVETIILE